MSLNAENEVSLSIRISNARGQRTAEVDRLGFATHWAYDAGGNLLNLTDAEAQATSYTYNDAGQRITEQYPDHIAGAVIGDAGYGIITFSYDALGRRTVKEDQQGDTTSYNFDMSGRMLTRVYVGHPTGPLAGQTDTDTFTYDRNGRMLSGIKGRYNNTVTFRPKRNGLQSDVATVTISTALLLPYLGFREGNSVPTVPPSRAETEPGAIGDIEQVEDPHAGHGIADDLLHPLYLFKPMWHGVYNGLVSYLTDGIFSAIPDFMVGRFANPSDQEHALLIKYLAGTGTHETIPVAQMIASTSAAQNDYEVAMQAAMELVSEFEFVGTVHLTEMAARLKDAGGGPWELGIGQYTTWGDISVTGSVNADGSIKYEFTYTYNFWDPYDWHPLKGGITTTDFGELAAQAMARFHLYGWAKQFMMRGEMTKSAEWSNSENVPAVPPAVE